MFHLCKVSAGSGVRESWTAVTSFYCSSSSSSLPNAHTPKRIDFTLLIFLIFGPSFCNDKTLSFDVLNESL